MKVYTKNKIQSVIIEGGSFTLQQFTLMQNLGMKQFSGLKMKNLKPETMSKVLEF